MANWFVGKVALVTGAGSGIGRASAQKFTQEHWNENISIYNSSVQPNNC